MLLDIKVRKADHPDDLDAVFAIRRKVFVDEQKCPPELEWEFEEESQHFLATIANVPAGASRWRRTEKGIKLERFAVIKEYRGSGVGQALVKAVVEDIPKEEKYLYLHAQVPAMGLYTRFGFRAEGKEFEEAGIRHYKMVLRR